MRVVATITHLGLITACLAGTSVTAGEKVRLSGKAPVTDPAETGHYIRQQLKSRGPAALGATSRRPSLQGVTTSPFQLPSRPTGRILTKQEPERTQAKADRLFHRNDLSGLRLLEEYLKHFARFLLQAPRSSGLA